MSTPRALIDLDRLEANTARMSERMGALGVRLRPHVKTHKCPEVARFQVRGHFGGITVSTLAEARYFAAAGFRDITYAVPIAPSRLAEAAEISRELEAFNLLVDHGESLRKLEACAEAQDLKLSVFLKVDCGYHRVGVDPQREESVKLAMRMDSSPHVAFRGILTHAGHSYHCGSPESIREVAEQERAVMAGFAEKLGSAGITVAEVSVGSTPTMSLVENLEGITEARPGNYALYDAFQAAVGSCGLEDPAYSVLVTIASQYPDRNELLIDAGALVFSKDEGPRHLDPDCGYGVILSMDGSEVLSGLRLDSLSQEHGKIVGREPLDYDRLAVGSKLRVIPNHSCLSAALFPSYQVIRGSKWVDEWKPVRGW